MTIYDLKSRFQDLLRPLCRGLAAAGVTANQVTVAALLLSCLGGVAVYLGEQDRALLYLLPPLLFLRMALNAIDGMLAREFDMQSPLGAVLNELTDVVSDLVLYLPFALYPEVTPAWVVLFVVVAALVEMTGVVGVQIGASRRYDGPMGKSDRAFLLGLVSLLLALGWINGAWLNALFALALLLSVLTVLNRARKALAEL